MAFRSIMEILPGAITNKEVKQDVTQYPNLDFVGKKYSLMRRGDLPEDQKELFYEILDHKARFFLCGYSDEIVEKALAAYLKYGKGIFNVSSYVIKCAKTEASKIREPYNRGVFKGLDIESRIRKNYY